MHAALLTVGAGLLAVASSAPTHSKRDANAVVTGSAAVSSINDEDGVGAGSNSYTSYSGDGSTGAGWPDQSAWGSFNELFSANMADMMIGCEYFGQADPSSDEINDIRNAIETIAANSQLDHRFILAVMMQESNGCVRVPTTNNGISNPGLMQSFEGTHSCNDANGVQNPCPSDEITGMIQDGAQGTDSGDGLATDVNSAQAAGTSGAQSFYYAARLYNSGSVCDGDLSNACGATASYASDIANRLTGWLGN